MTEPTTLDHCRRLASQRQHIIDLLERRIDSLEAELRSCTCTKDGTP